MDTAPHRNSDREPRAGAAEHPESRYRRRRSGLFMVGLAFAFLFVAFEILPLAAVCIRAPLRMLKIAQCCAIVRQAMMLSLATSLTTTALAFVIGTPVAYTIAMHEFRGKRLLEVLIELPLTLPPVVAGVALLLAFGRNGYLGKYMSLFGFELSFTQTAVIMAQFMVASPYYVKAAISAFQMVPKNLLLASRTLGAGPVRTLFSVALPVCRNALLAGLALTWARAVGEFGATIMFAGNFPGRTQTMPLAVLTTMHQNLHAGFVLSAMMLTMCLSVFVIVRLLLQPRAKTGSDITAET